MSYPKGSMLQRPIKLATIALAYHIGVYVGQNKVIHFGYPATDKVILSSLSDFSNGQPITIKQQPNDDNHANTICLNAWLLLETPKNDYNQKYNIFFNNCEDFARQCYGLENNLVDDQWEHLRNTLADKSSQATTHVVNATQKMAKELSAEITAKNILNNSLKSIHKTALGKKTIEVIAEKTLGKSAAGHLSNIAKGNIISGTATTLVLTGPDLYRALFKKSVSWQQVTKNLATNGAMVAGGIGGWATGATIGTALLPVVGTFIGGVLGSIALSSVAKETSKKTLDLIHQDDAITMQKLLEDELVQLCNEFFITKETFETQLIPKLNEVIDSQWLRAMYQSGETDSERAQFAATQCRAIYQAISASTN